MTKAQQILDYLKAGNTITHRQCQDHGWGDRLAARIRELREDGHRIETQRVAIPGGWCARYRMAQE